ncbi:hypothetical protein L1987_46815 [Smallanthus sonchifolius]|uniref:Uncharacterized protein n=1 Tax=Smallanthus sonchifolius TaxID=185202 RepID=A0ACB9G0V0_9ASTR|nr:hypothetical protein L1987_46815 [Smallanthus sonchifolius]
MRCTFSTKHFVVPMAGAVLNAINTRLDAKNIATIIRHSEAKVFFIDHQYVPLASEALRLLVTGSDDGSSAQYPMPLPPRCVSEHDELDSRVGDGYQGGVLVIAADVPPQRVDVHLGVAARGGTNVCIRNTTAKEMYTSIAQHKTSGTRTMESVPRDGMTMGENILRGSSIMKGYLKDEKETAKAF